MDPLRTLILTIDSCYLRSLCIYEIPDDPECLLRLERTQARHPFQNGSFVVAKGDPIMGLHVWNARIPPLQPSGSGLSWATQTLHRFTHSLRLAAAEVQKNPLFRDVCAVYGATALFTPQKGSSGVHPMQRFGFFVQPFRNKLGPLGEFLENIFSYGIMWTYNPASVRRKSILGLRRTEMWMPVEELLRRYGTAE